MYKILADECVHLDLAKALRQAGLDVLTVVEAGFPSAPDEVIFREAVARKRILLTFDRGFGDIFRFDISGSFGVVIILIGQMTRKEIINLPLAFFNFQKGRSLAGKSVIIGKRRIRISQR